MFLEILVYRREGLIIFLQFMISNFLMCLGYVPNDGKETVNFMILERVMVHFFS